MSEEKGQDYKAMYELLNRRIKELEQAMQEFVDRCEHGEVRSRYTYRKFKDLLQPTESDSDIKG